MLPTITIDSRTMPGNAFRLTSLYSAISAIST